MKRDLIEMIYAVLVTQLALLTTMLVLLSTASIGIKISVIAFVIAFATVSYAALFVWWRE